VVEENNVRPSLVTAAVAGVVFVVVQAAPGQSRSNVERLWETNCASCHGDRGQGGGAGTRTLLLDELFDQSRDRPFFDAIHNGVPDGGMEAFGETLSDSEIWGLVVHIRELQARERRDRLGSPKAKAGIYTSKHHEYRIETVIDRGQGLRVPWSVDFLPDGRMLVADRPGDLRIFESGRLGRVIEGTPEVRNRGQGGLMGVAPHPRFAENGWIYLSFSEGLIRNDRSHGFTKIVRGRIKDGAWTDQETIYEVKPEFYQPSDLHFGCRLVFQPAGDQAYYLFFPTGERGYAQFAPDLGRPNGKVHRLFDDGRVPEDNPFAAEAKDGMALGSIWSYGHRNPQGLVFDLEGRLWDTEHGPRGGDELNLVLKGRDYGWPRVSFGINYNNSPLTTPWPGETSDIVMPVDRWLPSIGACGLDVVRGDAFPGWKGDLVAGGLSGQNVDRFKLSSGESPRVLEREELVHGLGRVRDVVCGPDGSIYVVLNDPDKVVRLVPAKSGEKSPS
jgi:aldose sugar dehydrogenase